MIGMCWTNTMPNVPPWGGVEPAIGNNPLVIAVPRAKGHVVLDMAMSQFSYGALESYRKRGELLPVEGGFDAEGKLTRDPAAIEKSQRLLPVGLLEGIGAGSCFGYGGGDDVAGQCHACDCEQSAAGDRVVADVCGDRSARRWEMTARMEQIADEVVESLHSSRPAEVGKPVRYPGENTLRLREENRRLGLPVEEAVWEEILRM